MQVFCSPSGDTADVCLSDVYHYLLHQASIKSLSVSHGEENVPASLVLVQVRKLAEAQARSYAEAVKAKGKTKKATPKAPCATYVDDILMMTRPFEEVKANALNKAYIVDGEAKGQEAGRLHAGEVIARRVATVLCIQKGVAAVSFTDVTDEATAPLMELLKEDDAVVKTIQELRAVLIAGAPEFLPASWAMDVPGMLLQRSPNSAAEPFIGVCHALSSNGRAPPKSL